MKAPTRFHFTQHAMRRAGERLITEQDFIRTVLLPTSQRQLSETLGHHGGFRYIFKKADGSRMLCIIAEILKEDCFFITGYWQ